MVARKPGSNLLDAQLMLKYIYWKRWALDHYNRPAEGPLRA